MLDILKRNNVIVSGQGTQAMVFAHGYGYDQHVWHEISREFSSDFKLISFDYVGAGLSDLSAYDSEKYSTLQGYKQDILDIYEALELQDTIFIGHSVSCMIGLLAAIQKPELFHKMIFLGPSPRYLNDEGYIGGFEQSDLDDLFKMMDNNYLGWSKAIAPSIMSNPDRPELGQKLTNSFCATDPEIAKQFARVTFLSDNRADLPKLKVPSLTLQCSHDIIAPVEVGHYMHAHLQENTLIILEATGHCPHMSAPDETIKFIKSYLSN